MPNLKRQIRDLLSAGDLEGIAGIAGESNRVLDLLFPLTYDPDPLTRWRAVEASGRAAERAAERDPRKVLDRMRRMLWLLSEESGGVGWHAPEVIAEIAARLPKLARDVIPVVVSLPVTMAPEDLERFKPGLLWAIGRLGPLALEAVPAVRAPVAALLRDPDPQVRGLAAWCLGRLGAEGFGSWLESMLEDGGRVSVWREGRLEARTVAELAAEALGR